jgi:hypothetical protein
MPPKGEHGEVTAVSRQLSQKSTPTAMAAVTNPPTSCTSPVPTRFRMPSASVMMREISAPVLVPSKYDTGSRRTCRWSAMRMSVMARCAAMLTTATARTR